MFTWHVDGELGHLVNPQLTLSEEIQDGPEGCLSIPGLTIDCMRALSVVAHGFDMYGEPVLVEGSEMLARAIQHETDHLDGILFVDRLDREARKEAMRFIREAEWFGGPDAAGARSRRTPPTGSASDPVKVVFAGTPEAALPALRAVAESRHELVGVVTRPDAPAGRGRKLVASPVAARAEELGVPVLKPEHPRDPDFQARAARAASRLLPGRRLRRAAARSRRWTIPEHGWVNLHFSVLPAWRGAAPVQHAIWAGDEVTGATTFRIVAGARRRVRRTA